MIGKRSLPIGILVPLILVAMLVPQRAAAVTGTLGFDAGYRVDQFHWSIAGAGDVNVLSELTWDDLEIFQVGLDGSFLNKGAWAPFDGYGRWRIGYGWIVDGRNQDSDFNGPNRTLEWSRSNNQADDGEVWDISVGLGPRWMSKKNTVAIAALGGFSYREQHLAMTDGLQTVSEPQLAPEGVAPVPLGPIGGLDSKYETRWVGPWIGLELVWDPAAAKFQLRLGAEHHWADYEAEGQWNLREDLAQPTSFIHRADGSGVILEAEGVVGLTRLWSLTLNASYLDWSTTPGVDTALVRLRQGDGSVEIVRISTPLNRVDWESISASIGLQRRF